MFSHGEKSKGPMDPQGKQIEKETKGTQAAECPSRTAQVRSGENAKALATKTSVCICRPPRQQLTGLTRG